MSILREKFGEQIPQLSQKLCQMLLKLSLVKNIGISIS